MHRQTIRSGGNTVNSASNKMVNTSFNEFANTCKEIAANLGTIVEVKEYKNYGWGQVSFKNDNFGGTYVCLHFDMKTNKVTNWYGSNHAREISDLSFLSYFVKSEMEKNLKERNQSKVYDMINEEY